MYHCSFELNNLPMSAFKVGERSFAAFSGLDPYVNKRTSACTPDVGPIPPGEYHIVDRESGGTLGWLYDAFGQRGDWFALYAMDGRLDDETYCKEVKRGRFRLHPKVGRGISKGCITMDRQADFQLIRALLVSTPKQHVNGSRIRTYGTVVVR